MSVHPKPSDPKSSNVEAKVSWNVLFGSELHRITFHHDYYNKLHFELDLDGADKTVFTLPPPPSQSTLLCCLTCGGNKKRIYATPVETTFELGSLKVGVTIIMEDETFLYKLKVNDLPFTDYQLDYYKKYAIWIVKPAEIEYKVVLDKATLELWINGEKVKKSGADLEENGTTIDFELDNNPLRIEIETGNSTGTTNTLYLNDEIVPLTINMEEDDQRCEAKIFITMDKIGVS